MNYFEYLYFFVVIGAATYKYNLPENFTRWLSILARPIIFFAFLSSIQYLIAIYILFKKSFFVDSIKVDIVYYS